MPMNSRNYITLMILGAAFLAVVIFVADTRVSAQHSEPTANVASDLDQVANRIQDNLSTAGVAQQLTNLRSQLPSFAEFTGATTAAPVEQPATAPIQPTTPDADLQPTPTPIPTVVGIYAVPTEPPPVAIAQAQFSTRQLPDMGIEINTPQGWMPCSHLMIFPDGLTVTVDSSPFRNWFSTLPDAERHQYGQECMNAGERMRGQ